jgi:hypothetical protein
MRPRNARIAPQSWSRIFALPLILALCSFAGLVLGLMSEDWRDWVSIALLCLPLASFTLCWRARRSLENHSASKRKTK